MPRTQYYSKMMMSLILFQRAIDSISLDGLFPCKTKIGKLIKIVDRTALRCKRGKFVTLLTSTERKRNCTSLAKRLGQTWPFYGVCHFSFQQHFKHACIFTYYLPGINIHLLNLSKVFQQRSHKEYLRRNKRGYIV